MPLRTLAKPISVFWCLEGLIYFCTVGTDAPYTRRDQS